MGLINVDKFKFFSQVVLPAVYDESLSYYEVLNKVRYKLNEIIDSTNAQNETITQFINEINNNFDNFVSQIISEYNSSKQYNKGDYCWYNDNVYKANNTTTGVFDSSKWDEVVFADAVAEDVNNYIEKVDNLIGQIAPAYRNYFTYEVGEMCVYEDEVYVCRTRINPPENFNPEHWDKAIITTELKNRVDNYWNEFIEDYQETLGVVQTTGNSTTNVMSQNSTTENLNKKLALNYGGATTIPNSTYTKLDDVLEIGNYRVNTNEDATAVEAPISYAGRLICMTLASINHIFQVYIANIPIAGDNVYIRSKYKTNDWTEWQILFTSKTIQDIAEANNMFPISSNRVYDIQNELIANIANSLKLDAGSTTLIPNTTYPTFDSIINPGNYRTNTASDADAAGAPVPNAGRLIVLSTNALIRPLQIYVALVRANFRIYIRGKYGDENWQEWHRILTDNLIEDVPTENSDNLVSSGGVYSAINNAVANVAMPKVIPTIQPSSTGKIKIPNVIHNTEEINYHYVGTDGFHRGTTQGIASDGKQYLYFPLKRLGGESGDDEIPVICKWDASKNVPVLFNNTATKSYGHMEDMCFVPSYVKGFDNGNVDRLYLVDMNRSTAAGETGTIHVLRADNLNFITSFQTYDANNDANNLISKTLAPYWHGIYHIGYSSEVELFFVHSADSTEDEIRMQTLGVFDKDGNLIRGLNFRRSRGTMYGSDCDENYIYLSVYVATETPDVYDIYLSVFDWNLNPITTVKIDQESWEIEGICHIGNYFYITWIQSGGSSARDLFVTKSSYIKYNQFEHSQTFPVNWLDSVFNQTYFSPFVAQ